MIPDKIGRYKILSEIGRGGMAIVYLGEDPHMERKIAIKVLSPQAPLDDQLQERFQNEAKIIASLEHPAIVPIYDFGDHEGQLYLVMRYMQGGSLRDRLKNKVLTLAEASQILTRVSEALDKAHEKGIIHRDLKPDNILFDGDGWPYLADFGIARLAEATQTMTVIGTPAYMSPEQGEGDSLDHRCDIYALGVIIFEMLSGRQPYRAPTPIKLMIKHINEPIPNILAYNTRLPDGIQEVIDRSMAKNPDDRYPTASAVMADITELAALESAQSQPVSATTIVETSPVPAPISPPRDRPKLLPWLGIAALLVLLGLFIYFGVFRDGAQPETNLAAAQTAEVAAALVESTLPATSTRTPRPSNTPAPTQTAELEADTETLAAAELDNTATATATTAPTSTHTPIPTPTLSRLEVVVSSAYLRSGPGTVYSQVGLVSGGTLARIIARNSDSSWMNVELEDGTTGWIATSVTDQSPAAVAELSIAVTIPVRPTATSTTAPTAAPSSATQPPTDGGTTGGGGGGGSGGGDDGGSAPPPTAANPRPTAANP